VLDTVRLIELEAEFNPLYEGVPLFGDIDRFLRNRGFVLWRLRDLTHYTQRDAPLDWRSEESFNFDDDISHFPAGAGQLYWANAYYVRHELAYPDAAAGLESLVRDACIAGATGFVDLVGLAVNQARKSAPDGVRPVLDAAVSADVREARRNQELATASAGLTEPFTLEVDDSQFEGGGWRPAQRLDFGAVRWTGPSREAWIDIPFRMGPGCVVELLVLGALHQSIIDDLVVEVNRVPLALSSDHTDAGVLYRGTLPAGYASDRRFTRVMLRTTDTIPWNSVHPESPDDAELGIAVSWVRLSPPPEAT
ncbi:MAG: hypothetical protein M3011_12925, partial [Actinomycetota bacterium]|nr:hypothetical protein [Actinomycetota bacterium]